MKNLSTVVGQGRSVFSDRKKSHKFFRVNRYKKFMLQLLYEGKIIFYL